MLLRWLHCLPMIWRARCALSGLTPSRPISVAALLMELGRTFTALPPTMVQAARETGYFVSSVNLGEVTRPGLSAAVDHLLGQSVEGIIMVVAHDEALAVVRSQEARVPYVVVEGDLSSAASAVGVDQVRGARFATRHLLELGHTEIVHLCGPSAWTETRGRRRGWEEAMHAAGLRPSAPVVGDWSARSGYEAGLEIARRDEVTAVFCANDQMALGLLRALHESGRSVPDDVSDEDATNPAAVALPVLEQPGGVPVVPVFTSELEMSQLLPFISRYRLVPLGALASQWPADDLSLTIDGSSEHRLTLTSEGVRTLLARS